MNAFPLGKLHSLNALAYPDSERLDHDRSLQRRLHIAKPSGIVHEIDPFEDPRWAEFVERHPQASAFHTLPWLDALRQTYGYAPIVYTTSPPGRALLNGAVFCRVHSWITGRRLVSLPFSDHCEPLIDSAEDMESILNGLRTRHDSGNWNYVEVRPLRGTISQTEPGIFRASKKYYLHTMDIGIPERELFHRLHKDSIQRRIQRAEHAGLTYECGRSEALLKKFYGLMILTRRRHRMPPQPEKWFRNLLTCMGEALQIHVASHDGLPVAAVITLQFKNKAVYKYGGSDQAFHSLGSMPFILWKAVQKAQAGGAQTFDLGRSDYGNQGAITFKDRWASTRTELTYWRLSRHTQDFSPGEGRAFHLAQSFFGLLPNSMLRLTGELIYRHVG